MLHPLARFAQLPQFGRRRIVWRCKHCNDALVSRALAFAITAAGGLCDLVESRLGSLDPREIDIDSRFYQ